MKYIKTYEGLFYNDTDKKIENFFNEIKETFNNNNLEIIESNGSGIETLKYKIDDILLKIERSDYLYVDIDYVLFLNDKEIKCKNSLKRKIWKFLKKKADIYQKENSIINKLDKKSRKIRNFNI